MRTGFAGAGFKGLDNLVLPFTNVINSFYARQASTKTRAAHQARARSGMFMGSRGGVSNT